MDHHPATNDPLSELQEAWVQAETRADVGTLEAIATADFMLVGPVGFVLDKEQWLDRYRQGDLVTQSLSFDEPVRRVYGNTAVTIARHVQRAEYKGQPADGQFRTTHIAVRTEAGWRLAGMQLSAIGGPPPFAPRADQEEGPGIGEQPR